MTHTEYVKDLTRFTDERGKELSASFLEAFRRMNAHAKGLNQFMALMANSKKRLIQDASKVTRTNAKEAIKIGQDFGKAKLSGV